MKVKTKIHKNTRKISRIASGEFAGVTFHRMNDGSVIIDARALAGIDVTLLTQETLADEGILKPEMTVDLNAGIQSSENSSLVLEGKTYHIGDVLPDGWILGPVSPSVDRHLLIEPVTDTDKCVTWGQANTKANKYKDAGVDNVRLPDRKELKAIFYQLVLKERNENAKLGMCEAGSASYYWASRTCAGEGEWAQNMSNGKQDWFFVDRKDAVCARVVRHL